MNPIVGIGIAFVVVIVVVLIKDHKDTIRGACPQCHSQIGLLNGIGACHRCGEALKWTGGGFNRAESGFVADTTKFIVRLSQLKAPALWHPVWEGRCCVCGNTADREDRLKITSIEGQTGPLLTPLNLTATTDLHFGYCRAHRDGIRFSYPPGYGYAKKNDQCLLAMRSADFYRDFMKLNGLSS